MIDLLYSWFSGYTKILSENKGNFHFFVSSLILRTSSVNALAINVKTTLNSNGDIEHVSGS